MHHNPNAYARDQAFFEKENPSLTLRVCALVHAGGIQAISRWHPGLPLEVFFRNQLVAVTGGLGLVTRITAGRAVGVGG